MSACRDMYQCGEECHRYPNYGSSTSYEARNIITDHISIIYIATFRITERVCQLPADSSEEKRTDLIDYVKVKCEGQKTRTHCTLLSKLQ